MTTTDFFIPRSLNEAVGLLSEYGPELTIMGGGTLIMYQVNEGMLFPRKVMSLQKAGLDSVQATDDHVEIGATVTLNKLTHLDELPILAQASRILGAPAVRNMATIGGNLFAPAPYSDLSVPLLALDAEVVLQGKQGVHTLPLRQFLSDGPERIRELNELVIALRVPRPQGKSAYLKLGRRHANTPSVVAVAINIVTNTDAICTGARIALGAAGPRPMRAAQAEAALVGERLDENSIAAAAEAAMHASDPYTDALATTWYRRRMIGVYVRKALEQVLPFDSAEARSA